MGKRQNRIFANEIKGNESIITNKEVNLVLKSGKTVAAIVLSIEGNQFVLKDHFLQKHNVRLEEIEEIVLDFIASH